MKAKGCAKITDETLIELMAILSEAKTYQDFEDIILINIFSRYYDGTLFISDAAKALKFKRTTLYARLRNMGLQVVKEDPNEYLWPTRAPSNRT